MYMAMKIYVYSCRNFVLLFKFFLLFLPAHQKDGIKKMATVLKELSSGRGSKLRVGPIQSFILWVPGTLFSEKNGRSTKKAVPPPTVINFRD